MKIAFDAQLLFEKQKTGVGWCAQRLINELVQIPDIECTLNCFPIRDRKRQTRILAFYKEKGCRINMPLLIPARVYNHLERYIPVPYGALFPEREDITQFFNYTIPYGAIGRQLTFIHDMAFLAFPETVEKRTRRWLNCYIRKYCKRASLVLTVSEFSRQEIHRYMGVPLEKVKVVYNGVDPEFYHPGYPETRIRQVAKKFNITGDYILYLGTLEPRKNIETLINAYFLLKKSGSTCPKLVLAGKKGWLYDSIFSRVQENHLENDVIFTGYVPEEDVPVLMNGARIFLFPSLYEGFGIPPLEAMACGTPVITSNSSSLPEVVGDAGLMVPPKDAKALADGIMRILTDDQLYGQLQEAGMKRARRFTWKRSAETLAGIYREMMAR